MRLEMDCMKEHIVREVKRTDDYKEIFSLFVTCLRSEGITYQIFRTRQNKRNAAQIDLPFLNENHLN